MDTFVVRDRDLNLFDPVILPQETLSLSELFFSDEMLVEDVVKQPEVRASTPFRFLCECHQQPAQTQLYIFLADFTDVELFLIKQKLNEFTFRNSYVGAQTLSNYRLNGLLAHFTFDDLLKEIGSREPVHSWFSYVNEFLYSNPGGCQRYDWAQVTYMITSHPGLVYTDFIRNRGLFQYRMVVSSNTPVGAPIPYSVFESEGGSYFTAKDKKTHVLLAQELEEVDPELCKYEEVNEFPPSFLSPQIGPVEAPRVQNSVLQLDEEKIWISGQTTEPYAVSSLTQAQLDFADRGPSVPLIYSAEVIEYGSVHDHLSSIDGGIALPDVLWMVDHWEVDDEFLSEPRATRCVDCPDPSYLSYYVCTCDMYNVILWGDLKVLLLNRPICPRLLPLDLDVIIAPFTSQKITETSLYEWDGSVPSLPFSSYDRSCRLIVPDVTPWIEGEEKCLRCPLYYPIFTIDSSFRFHQSIFGSSTMLSQKILPNLEFIMVWNTRYRTFEVSIGSSPPVLAFFQWTYYL